MASGRIGREASLAGEDARCLGAILFFKSEQKSKKGCLAVTCQNTVLSSRLLAVRSCTALNDLWRYRNYEERRGSQKLAEYQDYGRALGKYVGAIRRKDFYSDSLDKIQALGISSVTELGMGSGDFLWHLPSPVRGIGLDKSRELVEVAKQTRNKPNLKFKVAEIGEEKDFEKSDLVVITGFLCTFLDYRVPLKAAIETSTKHIFINDFLNDYGVDARFYFRENGQPEFQTPYNIWSRETIEGYLGSFSLSYEINPYTLQAAMPEQSNPLLNYRATLDTEEVTTNGGGILLNGANIFITKA